MSWEDHGTIFTVKNISPFAHSHFYVPTAIELENSIRIYGSFWDKNKYGRLGYVDVDKNCPTNVLQFSKEPILEDSRDGCFDCDGVTPLSILQTDNQIRLYYAGWQKFNDIDKPYTLYSGLAISSQNGDKFTRFSDTPIIGRRNCNENIRTAGQIINNGKNYQAWLATQTATHTINGKLCPVYNLESMTSTDGISWPEAQTIVFTSKPENIIGYGKSAIWIDKTGTYHGLFSVRKWDGRYSDLYYATSKNGISWSKLQKDGMAFTTQMTCDNQDEVCFPSIIHQKDRTLMFYNGNEFGREGLRLAIWTDN